MERIQASKVKLCVIRVIRLGGGGVKKLGYLGYSSLTLALSLSELQ